MLPTQLIRRHIAFNFGGQKLTFDANQSLFSTAGVDLGTQALLNSLRKNDTLTTDRVLDLGCGYGPIAIFLKSQDPSRTIDACDRDALAVAFTEHNAEKNNVDVNAFASLGYSNVKEQYDLIACNIPAKIGPRAIKELIHMAGRHLTDNGQFAFVIVREHEALVDSLLDVDGITVTYSERKRGHLIKHAKYSDRLVTTPRPYRKSTIHLPVSPPLAIETAYSIPEFDTPSYGTLAFIKLIKRTTIPKRIVFLEPGQGIGPALLGRLTPVKEIKIYSKDLLSMDTTLEAVKTITTISYSLELKPYLDTTTKADLAILQVYHKNDRATNAYNLSQLDAEHLIIYGPRPAAKDFLSRGKLIDSEEVRHHGAYLLQPK